MEDVVFMGQFGFSYIYSVARPQTGRSDPGKIKAQITAKTNKIARKITAKKGRTKPGFKTKFMFTMMRSFQKKNNYALLDKKHWEDRQWLGKKRPWT